MFLQIITWTEKTGEEFLLRHAQLGDNLKAIRTQQKEFEKFYFSAMVSLPVIPKRFLFCFL
jgi:hypothetical protein